MFSNVFCQVGNFSGDGGRVQRAVVVVIHVDFNRFVTKKSQISETKHKFRQLYSIYHIKKNDDEFDLRVIKAVSGSQNVLGTDDSAATQAGRTSGFLLQNESLNRVTI